MRRGTTPVHSFETDVDLTDAEVIYITYKQNGKVVLEKEKADIEVTSEGISTKLTQKDTLAFNTIGEVAIQIRAKFADETAIASNVIRAKAEEILKDGEI